MISPGLLAQLIRERDQRKKTQTPEEKQAHARRVLEVQYGIAVPEQEREAA